jgi:pimeloyl-ACP methyl ester carboxylesterase
MDIRKYGKPPYSIVVVHGGPGAPGEMAPVARELSKKFGVLEPLQTATSVRGQVAELKRQIKEHADGPVTIVGYSWGAWLSYLLAADYPDVVKKLILVSSGPFEAKYAAEMNDRRRSRLSPSERQELEHLLTDFSTLDDKSLSRLGHLTKKTDLYDPLDVPSEVLKCDSDSFKNVWPEAAELRASGELLAFAKKIVCPLTAIHGEFDPHPPRGVELPLKERVLKFKFVEIEKCGHTPWVEKQARHKFFHLLFEELVG